MFNSLKTKLSWSLFNLPGWRTNRKILIIESDDWGGIRMRSNRDYFQLCKKINLDKNHYNRLDCLETEQDLQELFDCLLSFKDIHGNHLKFTANFIVANPDFDKIRHSDFQNYYYETFNESYRRYYKSANGFDLINKGMENKIFIPQFHGREHVHVEYWLRDLQKGKKETIEGFNHSFFGFRKGELDVHGYLSSFNAASHEDLKPIKERIENGLNIFEHLFGYRSRSIIAPQNTMHNLLLPFLKRQGVEIIQGARTSKQSPIKKGDKIRNKRFLGTMTPFDQINVVRNASFEPSAGDINWVEKCFKEIETAFLWKKPAIISSHRVNYVGFLNRNNRENNVMLLTSLLRKVQKKWPQVEFLSTTELADLILDENASDK